MKQNEESMNPGELEYETSDNKALAVFIAIPSIRSGKHSNVMMVMMMIIIIIKIIIIITTIIIIITIMQKEKQTNN